MSITRRIFKFIFMLVFSGVFTLLFVSAYAIYIYVQPEKIDGFGTPADYNLKYEDVKIKTSDDILLSGWYIAANEPKGVIIVGHGYPTDKSDMLEYAAFLNLAGYDTLLFDWRHFGQSQGKFTSFGYHERKDVLAAVDFLKNEKKVEPEKIGALGISNGAFNFLITETNDIKAIVADSSFANIDLMMERVFSPYGIFRKTVVTTTKFLVKVFLKLDFKEIDAAALVKKSKVSLFLIHGADDQTVSYTDSIKIYEAAGGKKEIWLVEGADHVQAASKNPKLYMKKVIEFFNNNLL